MSSISDILKMSEADLLRRGSIPKTQLVQAIMELRKEKEKESGRTCSVSDFEDILSKKLDPIVEKLSFVCEKIERMEQRINYLQNKCDELEWRSSASMEEVCREAAERLYRREFVIVTGVPEQSNGSAEQRKTADIEAVQSVAKSLGIENLELSEVSRLGQSNTNRPRLLRLRCKDCDTRRNLLRSARNLENHPEYGRVYINPDQTKIQREHSKTLRKELTDRLVNGEDVTIKHGKIVQKTMQINFH